MELDCPTPLVIARTPGVVQSGAVQLSSGGTSKTYVDLRVISRDPSSSAFKSIVYQLSEQITDHPDALLCGVPSAGIPWSVALASITDRKLVSIVTPKLHGPDAGKSVVGNDGPVILVEDVCTTGKSLARAKEIITESGRTVVACICIVNRGAADVRSLCNEDDVKRHVKKLTVFRRLRAARFCVAVDVETYDDLVRIVDSIVEHVDVIKIHLDTLPLADRHAAAVYLQQFRDRVLIWEDRKCFDIPFVVRRQVLQAMKYADIVSVKHVEGASEHLGSDLPLIAIGSLTSEEGSSTAMKFSGRDIETYIGFVDKWSGFNAGLVRLQPGVRFDDDVTEDGLGQRYEKVTRVRDGQVYVVGRAVTKAEEPWVAAARIRSKIYE